MLELKSSAWNSKKEADVTSMLNAILALQNVDITAELDIHAKLKEWLEHTNKVRELNKQRATLESALIQAEKTVTE